MAELQKLIENARTHWVIRKFESLKLLDEWRLPGNISHREMEELLKRLASRHLTDEEVIYSSLRSNSRDKIDLLERIGNDPEIQVGQNPYYVASREQS